MGNDSYELIAVATEPFPLKRYNARMADVVVTALFGQYEKLNELRVSKDIDTEYVCFTDDLNLKSKSWNIVPINIQAIADPIRKSRFIKMFCHRYFPQGSRVLYIDNSVELTMSPKRILDSWLMDQNLAFMDHSERRTVRNEFLLCSIYGLDKQEIIYSQYRHYKTLYPNILEEKPLWGGMIARKNNIEVEKFMATWWQLYSEHSRRDQLCINLASTLSGVAIRRVMGRNSRSEWHVWPTSQERKVEIRDNIRNRKYRKLKYIVNALFYSYRYFEVSSLKIATNSINERTGQK